MKVFIRLAVVLFVIVPLSVKGQDFSCSSWTYLMRKVTESPELQAKYEERVRLMRSYAPVEAPARYSAGVVFTIPVVVHIIYNNEAENISDAQVYSQLNVLNKDFRFRNSDKLPASHPFSTYGYDAEIEFCLATKDPNDSSTTGIIRKYTTAVNGFTDDDRVKHSNFGGDDAWDATRYLNIWVCKLQNGLLGYASFPESPWDEDGIVVSYNAFGTNGAVETPYNKGRTATHEVGHWLGLYHTWGDEFQCNSDDWISDTPLQAAPTTGCPSGELTDPCTYYTPGIMYQNYMDYTNDACKNLFTYIQVYHMRATLGNQRREVVNNDRCENLTALNVNPEADIRIYPNPASGRLYIESPLSPFDFQVIDKLGQLVLEQQQVRSQQTLDVERLPAGYYTVRMVHDDFVTTKKILILH